MGSTKKWSQLWITAISWKTLRRSSPSMLCKRKMRKKDLRNTEDRPRISLIHLTEISRTQANRIKGNNQREDKRKQPKRR